MRFLDPIDPLIKSEKEMLWFLRDAAEKWFNELSTPFVKILVPETPRTLLSISERERLAALAEKMLHAELLINAGNALENKLAEIDRSSGLPLFSGRTALKARITEYVGKGVFLKKFVYGNFRSTNHLDSYREVVKEAHEHWQQFEQARIALVTQINAQLAAIG